MEDTTANRSPRLYGRANETELLRQWYATVANDAIETTSMNRMLLGVISGPDGIGKRALIHTTLLPHVKQSNGMFLSGQFHSAQNDKSTGKTLSSHPFSAICEALNQLVPSLNDDDNDNNNSLEAILRDSLLTQFAGDGDRLILSELVKPLSQWIFRFRGDDNPQPQQETVASPPVSHVHPPFAKLSSINIQKSQCDVLVRLIQLIAFHVPLVLYLEHVESAGCASFELLELLVNNDRTTENHVGTRLLLVLSLVDESVLPNSIWTYTQQIDTTEGKEEAVDVRKMISVEILRLRPIAKEHLFTWVIEHFGHNDRNDHVLQEVADMIYENSDCGNAQCILFHLSYLSLHIDVDAEWNDATIDILRSTITSCSSNEIYTKILQNANPVIRAVVDLVAVLMESGRRCVDAAILEIVLQQPCAATLDAAQAIGLLESYNDTYFIPTPELQSVVYGRIPESKRTPLHLRIGRKLWKHVNLEDPMTDESADMLDIVSRNLQLGQGLMTDMMELDIIVRINLSAGRHAAASSSFVAAAEYFESAISALGNRAWTDDCYAVSLVLYNYSSETYYCIGNYERMDETLNAVLDHARTLHDKLQAYTTLLYANGARGYIKEALDMTLDVLHQLDEGISTNAGILTFYLEYFKTKRQLINKSVRYFLSLPAATNEDKIAVMQMLNFTMLYAYMIYPICGAIATFRLIQLALKYGIAAPAIPAFGSFGFLSCLAMGNRELGVRCGQIALALLDQNSAKTFFLARTYLFVHGGVNYWGFPLRESLEPLRIAHWSARKTGDVGGHGNSAYYFIELSCLAGRQLAPLEHDARLLCQEKDKLGHVLVFLVPQYQFIKDLQGSSSAPLHLTGPIVDSTSALRSAEKAGNKPAIGAYYNWEAMLCCFHGKYSDTLNTAKKSRAGLPVDNVWLSFHEGIAALAIARNVTGTKHWHYMCIGRRAAKFVKQCAKTCPSNFSNKQFLLEAELASVQGKIRVALALFNESIKKAQQESFVHEVGLAYERLAQYQMYLGNSMAAAPLLVLARDAYDQWGAQSLVQHVEQELAMLQQQQM